MTDSQLSQPRPGSQCSLSPLWEKALAQLEPDVRACLEQGARSGGGRDVVAALLKTVAEKRKLCIRRQYKLRMPGGRVVILRDVLEKMARWLDRFKGAVDAAVQYDPAHAALPWAVVRFILQVALDEIQAHGSIFEALAALTRIMARCARVEELHLRKAGVATMSAALEEALTRLYAAILGSLATALKYFDKSHARRLFAVIIEPSTLQSLENEEQDVLKVVSPIDSETIQELDKQVHRVMDTSTMIQTSMDKTRTSECLTWLSSTRVHDHHRSVSAAKIPSSCAWLFKQDTYRTRLEDSCSSLLVLHGIRGYGKSVLMSAVVDSLRELAAAAATTTLDVPWAVFYCADSTNEPDRAAPDAMLRSIIRQLAVVAVDASTCTIDEKLWTLYSKKLDTAQPDKMNLQVMDVEECFSLLLEMTLTNPAYLVIDAVDELSETARARLLRVIHRVLSASGSLVKILISSRDNTHMEALLPAQTFKLRVSARLNDGDMTAFIHGQMDEAVATARLLNGNLDPRTKEKLALALKDGAREMTSEQDVIAAIEAGLVATLDELYADVFRALFTRESFSRAWLSVSSLGFCTQI